MLDNSELVTSPVSAVSDETEESLKKPKISEPSHEEAVPRTRSVKPQGTIYPMGKGDRWQPWPRMRFFARNKETHSDSEETALARQNPHEMTAEEDPSDDYVGTTDVREVWFAGCHSGMFPPPFPPPAHEHN